VTLDELNVAPAERLLPRLLACADVPRWAETVSAGRPYADEQALLETADEAARELTRDEVDRALAAHPRIGERARRQGTEAAWSRDEQAGVSPDEATRAALLEANHAYEERFGRVFLVCATGLSGPEVLAALRARLAHDETTEDTVVADELRKIALLRLRKVLDR
jgi:2-oxo-4-hydroxy-4-carboxy-5-ureidoimidazoline decarboxylase